MPNYLEAKSILNKTKRRDPWFLDDYTINPYSGCSFNCLFCYIRGSKYGIHMEDKLSIKSNAVELLDRQLAARAKKGQYGIIVLSSATDPYLHFEKEEQLTRQMLEVILKHRFPLHVITRSDLVVRDFDLLQEINDRAILPADLQNRLNHKVFLTFSFSTLDPAVARIFEPGATPPHHRLLATEEALKAGFLTGVSLMPLLPFISDTKAHLELMFSTFQKMKVNYIFPATLTLHGREPSDSRMLVLRAVEKHYPHLLKKYLGYFDRNTEMPTFYQNAFYKKTEELCMHYGLKTSILVASQTQGEPGALSLQPHSESWKKIDSEFQTGTL